MIESIGCGRGCPNGGGPEHLAIGARNFDKFRFTWGFLQLRLCSPRGERAALRAADQVSYGTALGGSRTVKRFENDPKLRRPEAGVVREPQGCIFPDRHDAGDGWRCLRSMGQSGFFSRKPKARQHGGLFLP